jgi:hypothetical protein
VPSEGSSVTLASVLSSLPLGRLGLAASKLVSGTVMVVPVKMEVTSVKLRSFELNPEN